MTEPVRGDYQFGFHDAEDYLLRLPPGLTEETVRQISRLKNEPNWMLQRRLAGWRAWQARPLPEWGGDLSGIDFDQLTYFIRPQDKPKNSWRQVPQTIRRTFDRLGVPESEKKYLAGVGAQYESEAVYHRLKEEWIKAGVIFCDTDTALREHPDIIKRHFGTLVPANDNKFAALNTAVWSGGTFLYVPAGVKLDIPVQNFFRINARGVGQFERTLIIAEKNSAVHYIEGCTAPVYETNSLHAAVVEVIAKENARVRYTTIQNWSSNVYNLVTKRAAAHKNAAVEWVDGNLGSKLTMKYPAVYLVGRGAHADIMSLAVAGPVQHQDAGAKAVHLAANTTSRIVSKSICFGGGRSSYRGLVKVAPRAAGCRAKVDCDALIMDDRSRTDTYPSMQIDAADAAVEHEASVSRLNEEQLHFLRARGLSAEQAASLLVNGFIEPVAKELPLEYAVELNRLIELNMEDSVG